MTLEQKEEILQIAKEFASGFKPQINKIAGSGWLIVDPLSAYLDFCGYKNTLNELPANDKHGQILVMEFKDGSKLIPAGSDLSVEGAKDWLWLN